MKVVKISIDNKLIKEIPSLCGYEGNTIATCGHGGSCMRLISKAEMYKLLGLKDMPSDIELVVSFIDPSYVYFCDEDLKFTWGIKSRHSCSVINFTDKTYFYFLVSCGSNHDISNRIKAIYSQKYGNASNSISEKKEISLSCNTAGIVDISDNSITGDISDNSIADITIERLAGIITKLRSELEALKKVSTDNALKLSTLESENSELTKQNKELTQKCEMLDTIKSLFKTK